MSGSGTAGDPFVPVLILSEDADNIAECRDDGFYVGHRTLDFAFATRSSGNATLNSTTWANVDTGLDLTLTGILAGDVIEVGALGQWGQEATDGILDVASLVAGAPVNYWGGDGGVGSFGMKAWGGIASRFDPFGGGNMRAVVAGDLTAGVLVLRLRYRTAAATNKTFFATSNERFHWFAINHGPVPA